MSTGEPSDILVQAYQRAAEQVEQSFVEDHEAREKIAYICRCPGNRAGARLLLACGLAKLHNPSIDIRKPYVEAGENAYSGRAYDETYVTGFVISHDLPCNATTAFLTPALRTKPVVLEPGVQLGGHPPELYEYAVQLLNDVEQGHLQTEALLTETIRQLLLVKRERQSRISSLLNELKWSQGRISLSSEDVVALIRQHLDSSRSSRLPVLVVAAAYRAASQYLGERVLPLMSHTSADRRTGALGDVQIALVGDERAVTVYEMKTRQVTREDIDRALQKVRGAGWRLDNYIFITTEAISEAVASYAQSLYRETGGIEFAVLDCLGFVRHFLHLFHRLRLQFLDTYQELLLGEPESAVDQPLKEAFLALRLAAESRYTDETDMS